MARGDKNGIWDKISEDAIQINNEKVDTLIKEILDQMNYTRVQTGLSSRKFSLLLGLEPTTFYKSLDRGGIQLKAFLSFCLLFGFDLGDIVNDSRWRTKDSPLREFASHFETLSPEAMQDVSDAIQSSGNVDEKTKERMSLLIDAVKNLKLNRQKR